MKNKEKKLQEQEAPLKNNDDAFVRVGHNGEPVIPQSNEQEDQSSKPQEHTTTLDKR